MSTKLQVEIPGLLDHICVTKPSCQLCLSQTSSLQGLPLLVPLSLLKMYPWLINTKWISRSTSSPELSIAFFREEIHCSLLLWLWVWNWYTWTQNVRLESQKSPPRKEKKDFIQETFWFACRKNLCGFCLTGERVEVVCGAGAASTRHPGLNGIAPRTCKLNYIISGT